jgi:hypothetical protein
MRLEDREKTIRIELNLKEATMLWSLLNDEVFHRTLDSIRQDIFEKWYDTKKVGYIIAMGINSILKFHEVDIGGKPHEIEGEIDLQECVNEINARTRLFAAGRDNVNEEG